MLFFWRFAVLNKHSIHKGFHAMFEKVVIQLQLEAVLKDADVDVRMQHRRRIDNQRHLGFSLLRAQSRLAVCRLPRRLRIFMNLQIQGCTKRQCIQERLKNK